MDYEKLCSLPEWKQFWSESEIVLGKKLEIRRQLETTSTSDPHTLGKLRGQLEMLEQIPKLVTAHAEIDKAKANANFISDAPVRTVASRWPPWVPRIR